MEIVIHRVNEIRHLADIPKIFGCEIDIRASGKQLILNHEPYQAGDLLCDFLKEYKHGLLVLNIKEAGIESDVLDLVEKHGIKRYFLLDVEFPYIYKATRLGIREIAIRYSEDEPIEAVMKYKDKIDWVWIDTNTELPLNPQIVAKLDGINTCLVCPERWGRPESIIEYRHEMKKLGFTPTAVMTNIKYVSFWQSPI